MDETTAEATQRVTANELRQFIERFERLEIEKKDIAEISNIGDKVVTDDTNELKLDEESGSRD